MVRLLTFIGRKYLRTKHKRPSRVVSKALKKYECEKR